MSDKNTQAFPKQTHQYDGQSNVLQYQEDGMTLRDYFAAKAMQLKFGPINSSMDLELMAKTCYSMANAMMKARES